MYSNFNRAEAKVTRGVTVRTLLLGATALLATPALADPAAPPQVTGTKEAPATPSVVGYPAIGNGEGTV